MLLILSLGFVQASCPLKLEINQIQDKQEFEQEKLISVSQIEQFVQQSKGCLTLIELWASWCGPCRQIAPDVSKLQQSNPNLMVIQISSDSSAGAMSRFHKKHPPLSPAWRLESWSLEELGKTYSLFDASFPSRIPYFVLLDEHGTILLELTEPKDLSQIQLAINEHQSKSNP